MIELVFWGLSHPRYLKCQRVADARKRLVQQSHDLFFANYLPFHRVYENYNGKDGCNWNDANAGDPFYHWGALLALVFEQEQALDT